MVKKKLEIELPKCYKEGKVHSGDYLIELRRYNQGYNVEEVVNWCTECGNVVIDNKSDGRRFGSAVPMKFSRLVKDVI